MNETLKSIYTACFGYRCVGTGVLDLFKFQPPTKNFTSKISSKSMSLDKDGSFTFVDEGETAVVVSMDASFRAMSDRPVDQAPSITSTGMLGILSENRLDELFVKAGEDTEGKCVGAFTGAADSSLKESGIVASLIHPEKIADVQGNDQKSVRVDNPEFCANFMLGTSETVSSKPASAGIEGAENVLSEVASVKSQKLDAKDNSLLFLPSTNDAATISSASDITNDSLSRRNQKIVDGDKVLEGMSKREIGMTQETEHLKQEGSSDIQRDHSLIKKREPTHTILEKHKRDKKKLKSEDRVLISTNPSTVLGEHLSDDTSGKPDPSQVPDKQPIKVELIDKTPIKQELIDPVLDEVMLDYCTDLKSDAPSIQEVFKPKSEVMNELKELVQGLAPSHRRVILPRTNTNIGSNGSNEGVRTGKIIYRGTVQDGKTSKIMNEIRQHLKQEAVDLGIAGDNRKVDVTDEKFFVAFKAAVQSSLSQQLAPVKRMSLQKPGSKRDGSRLSLMKKLYGGTGKRRQAWDRDWDISFWRERVSNDRKARQSSRALLQQEMVHMEEAIQNSKEGDKAELDSLRSRVYLADTSLLPRQTDIKPLSEHSSSPKINSLTVRPIGNAKTAQGLSKQSTSSEGTSAAARDSNVSLKTDKRKWALEVLARKTGQQEKLPRNQGSLLAELPEHMRPVLEYDRRSKVPTATRQVQLDRFIEYHLQKAPIEFVSDNPECQAAISAAMTQEKEIYDKSNSKGVYVNLCVQTLASLSKVATPTAEEASSLEAAEPSSLLAAEPPHLATVETLQNGDIAVLMALKATGLISDSPPASPVRDAQESSCRNPPDMDKGFEERSEQDGSSRSIPDTDNSSHAGDCFSGENLESSCHELIEAQREVSCENGMENAGGEEASIEDPKQEKISTCMDNLLEKIREDGGLHAVMPQSVRSDEKFLHKDADCEQHGSLSDTPSQEGTLTIITDERGVAEEREGAPKEGDDCELQCSSINIPVQERPSANSQGITTETRVEDALHTSENIERVTKQVEAYVKDHIRPLRRSHVITTDQYIWAISKTTNKVMQHHAGAKSADFLISEGEKVRRLAEQYLQLYSEHMFHGTN